MVRFNNVSYCEDESSTSATLCDGLTCYATPSLNCSLHDCNFTDIVCFSDLECSPDVTECNLILQCSDGEMILRHQFCDGLVNCEDGSDEIRNQPGFKCVKYIDTCTLPQRNLYDDVAHCADSSDLCLLNRSCFECLDKRMIVSSKQVCDEVIDCYDLSDECLCEVNLHSPICNAMFTSDPDSSDTFCASDSKLISFNSSVFETNSQLIYALMSHNNIDPGTYFNQTHNVSQSKFVYCNTKNAIAQAILCDGRPTCRDFSDECDCENAAGFCNESCRLAYDSFYPFGDLYCDGIENEFAWEHLNESACPRGFDESLCPQRFYCKSGEKVSIDVSQVCNDVVDCDYGEDERNCSITVGKKLFSSDTEMIDNLVFQIAFWVNGFVIILATLLVIIRKVKLLKTATLTDSLRCQHAIILNISIADFIMGLYLLTVAVHSSIYSGYYGQVDIAWRSSWKCSVTGSLAVVSSVCMPKFFPARGETAWEFTLMITMINLLAFISIAACYIYLFYKAKRRSQMLRHNTQQRSTEQESKMQKRIATLIATDFVCWIPICIISYIRIGGVDLSNIVYQITAVFLLPINSVMNPFIYSLIPEAKITKKLFCCKKI